MSERKIDHDKVVSPSKKSSHRFINLKSLLLFFILVYITLLTTVVLQKQQDIRLRANVVESIISPQFNCMGLNPDCTGVKTGTAATTPCIELTVSAPLTLSKKIVIQGETEQGSITYKNNCTTVFDVLDIAISVTDPNGTVMSFTPTAGTKSVYPQQTITLKASFPTTASTPTGTWTAVGTFKDISQTIREDTNKVTFIVTPPCKGLDITTPFALDKTTLTTAETLTGTVTLRNNCLVDFTTGEISIIAKDPKGASSNFQPVVKSKVVTAGQEFIFTAKKTFTTADPLGVWQAVGSLAVAGTNATPVNFTLTAVAPPNPGGAVPVGTVCKVPSDCAANQVCSAAGKCAAKVIPVGTICKAPTDCAANQTCTAGKCAAKTIPVGTACKTAAECMVSQVCTANKCVAKPVAIGTVCKIAANCAANQTCTAGKCAAKVIPVGTACKTAAECMVSQVCTANKCVAKPVAIGTVCKTAANCAANQTCTAGKCAAKVIPIGTACKAATDCAANQVCTANKCSAKPVAIGTVCKTAADCTTAQVCTAGKCAAKTVPPAGPTCNNKYPLNNPLKKNFGDPACNFDKNKLYAQINQADSANAAKWFNIVLPCHSQGFNPNAYAKCIPTATDSCGGYDPAGMWGLFGMGRGLNGAYDHGDVAWGQQTLNAIRYNNAVLRPRGIEFKYWGLCARSIWGPNAR